MLSTGQLSRDHVSAVERLHGPVTVDRVCADLAELIAAARTTHADAALIVGGTEKITSAVLSSLTGPGLTVVIIAEAAAERSRLTSLGATTFTDDVSAEVLAEALMAGQPSPAGMPADQPAHTPTSSLSAVTTSSWSPEPAQPEPTVTSLPTPPTHPSEVGLTGITAVWGASGAPGRTTVAVNLAAELAMAGGRPLLVDADTYGAAAAAHLGLMQESAGLAQVCRSADVARLDAESLTSATSTVMLGQHRLDILTGLPRADRWTELRAHALELVFAQARLSYDHIIIDTAPWIEQDQELALDSGGSAPQRNTAARTALECADTVLALGAGDPVGFSRLVKAVQDLQEHLPHARPPRIVINQLRKEVIGRSPRRQLSDAWEQLGPGGHIADFLTWDRTGCDAALRSGHVLAEAAKDSALRRQIASLGGIEIAPRRRLLPRRSHGRNPRRRRVDSPAPRR